VIHEIIVFILDLPPREPASGEWLILF